MVAEGFKRLTAAWAIRVRKPRILSPSVNLFGFRQINHFKSTTGDAIRGRLHKIVATEGILKLIASPLEDSVIRFNIMVRSMQEPTKY